MTQVWRKVDDMSQEDWLVWRNKGLGGSDAPAIMGVSPWCTPYQKWEEKVFGKKQEDNACKKFGRDTEKSSRMEFEDLVGLKMNPCNVISVEYPWLRASLDGIDLQGKTIVEIKKANREDHALACEGIVTDKYFPQLQHILLVTGLPSIYYFSSPANGKNGHALPVFRNEEYIQNELFPKLQQFWEMVQTRTPPPFCENDVIPMDDNSEWKFLAEEWRTVSSNIKKLESEQDALKKQMIELAGGNARGHGLSLRLDKVAGRINYEAAFESYLDNMRSQYPDVSFPPLELDPFRKESFVKWTARDIA